MSYWTVNLDDQDKSSYDLMMGYMTSNMDSKKPSLKELAINTKGKRPLKMPKDYDFSVRNVNWKNYRNDYLLRTDAVWEKSKLLDLFYVQYKSKLIYDGLKNMYMICNIRQNPMPTNEPEHFEDWRPFLGFSDIDGCIWQWKIGPMLQNPTPISKFVSDKEADSWYICFLSFQKFMMCNERSPVKIDECHLWNRGFQEYPCFSQFEGIMENCG